MPNNTIYVVPRGIELFYNDIVNEIERHKIKFDFKLSTLFEALIRNFKNNDYPFSKKNHDYITYERGYPFGNYGIDIYGEDVKKTYNQKIFFGYYYDDFYHNLKFKKKSTPEIGVYFDVFWDKKSINKKELDKILLDQDFCKKIKSLKKFGFENNLNKNIKENGGCLFFKRKSIDEFDNIDFFVLIDFIEDIFENIKSVGLIEHKFFKELS